MPPVHVSARLATRILHVVLLLLMPFCASAAPSAPTWCDVPQSGLRAPGCVALDAIKAANAANDYSLNCLSIPYCAAAPRSEEGCRRHLEFMQAVTAEERNGGDAALLVLESVCWKQVETGWRQRTRAARALHTQLDRGIDGAATPGSGLPELELVGWANARAETHQSRVRYIMRYENDSLGLRSTDRDYTMGMSLSAVKDGWPADGWAQRPLLVALDRVNRALALDDDGIDATATTWWRFGSADFTPRRIKVQEIQENDTPYASLVLFTAGYIEERELSRFDSFLELGVLGSGLGREAQTAIHKVCCQQNIPKGWEHQVGNGGSATFRYHLQWSHAAASGYLPPGGVFELRPSAGAEIGYYTRALAGATLSLAGSAEDLAQVRNGILSGTETPLPRRNRAAEAIPGQGPSLDEETFTADAGTGYSLWLEYEVSGVAHNELLQGAWSGRNDVKFSYDEIEHFVWRAAVGVELTFLDRLINPWHAKGGRLYAVQQTRSRELVHGINGTHNWGGIYYSFGF